MKRLFLFLVCLATFTAVSFAQPIYPDPIRNKMANFPLLPASQLTTGQFSSHSPHQRNGDANHFLYTDEHGDAVIFEAYGAGAITSMWGTVLDSASTLKFYFDGERSPRYSVNIIDFFNGKHPNFPKPLVTYDRRGYYIEAAYAANSFAPIYFTKSLKIAVQGKPTFYHILYQKLPGGNHFSETSKKAQYDYLTAALSHISPNNTGLPQPLTKTITLSPGKNDDVLKMAGHGSIQNFLIEADTSTAFLQEVYLQMIWDDAAFEKKEGGARPVYEMNDNSRLYQVMTPLGIFFGSPHRVTELQALPVSIELLPNGRMKLNSRFAMPFWRNARISLVNKSGQTFENVQTTVVVDSTQYPEERTGYFATFYRQGITEYGRDWLFYESPGTGWFLGAVQSCRLEHYCEGNEHFYIDGNRTPQINGTGTEDYYLGCFWPNLKYHTAFAGCVDDVRLLSGGDPRKYLDVLKEDYLVPAVYYRFHLDMPVPFYSSIDARIQHGAESTIKSEYASLAYLYIKNKPVLTETDFIDVGNAASRKMHNYRSKGTENLVSARYEGNYLYTAIRDNGLQHGNNGEITFSVAVANTNKGVRLRRRTDQSNGRQLATVYVNGKLAGIWSDPQTNKILRWYDSEFDIPASLTKNAGSLDIKIVVNTNAAFNDYEYRVFSYE